MNEKPHYGYYIFLGLGDFGAPKQIGPEWTSAWDLAQWRQRLAALARLGTNTLFLFLAGHRLPYPSRRYPELVEADHPNVREDFLQAVLDDARAHDMEIVAVFSTTGHANNYCQAHPELHCRDREGRSLGTRAVCHHQPGAWDYSANVIEECLTRYQGFSGVILHPPEFSQPCFCGACQEHYRAACGGDLLAASVAEAKRFFMQTNLQLQREILEKRVQQLLPSVQRLVFTIPWVFKDQFETVAREIPKDTIIVEWDYFLRDSDLAALPDRLKRYRQFGHRVWFMPTSGYAMECKENKSLPLDVKEAAILKQVGLSRAAGVQDVVYFMGPVWWPSIERTSWHLQRRG